MRSASCPCRNCVNVQLRSWRGIGYIGFIGWQGGRAKRSPSQIRHERSYFKGFKVAFRIRTSTLTLDEVDLPSPWIDPGSTAERKSRVVLGDLGGQRFKRSEFNEKIVAETWFQQCRNGVRTGARYCEELIDRRD